MRFFSRIAKKVYFSVAAVFIILVMVFYGGYYIIRPSERGEDIAHELQIPYPAVIAHRGASRKAPESTRPAYQAAHEIGVDYVEADIHRTRDGRLVVHHDSTPVRTSNIEEIYPDRIHNHISTFTYNELLALDFGSWFNEKHPLRADPEYEGLQILTFNELLEITASFDRPTGIVLDMKGDGKYDGIEHDVIALLEQHGRMPEDGAGFADVIVFSFDLSLLQRFKEAAPGIPRMLLLDDNRMSRQKWSRWLEIAEEHAHGLGVKGFVSWPWHMAEAHDRSLFVFPYVINELWQLRILAHLNSSGYITDRPELVQSFLNIVPIAQKEAEEQ